MHSDCATFIIFMAFLVGVSLAGVANVSRVVIRDTKGPTANAYPGMALDEVAVRSCGKYHRNIAYNSASDRVNSSTPQHGTKMIPVDGNASCSALGVKAFTTTSSAEGSFWEVIFPSAHSICEVIIVGVFDVSLEALTVIFQDGDGQEIRNVSVPAYQFAVVNCTGSQCIVTNSACKACNTTCHTNGTKSTLHGLETPNTGCCDCITNFEGDSCDACTMNSIGEFPDCQAAQGVAAKKIQLEVSELSFELHLNEVAVRECNDTTNIAYGKPTASTMSKWGDAKVVVDGYASCGSLANSGNSFASASGEPRQWTVDLRDKYDICEISFLASGDSVSRYYRKMNLILLDTVVQTVTIPDAAQYVHVDCSGGTCVARSVATCTVCSTYECSSSGTNFTRTSVKSPNIGCCYCNEYYTSEKCDACTDDAVAAYPHCSGTTTAAPTTTTTAPPTTTTTTAPPTTTTTTAPPTTTMTTAPPTTTTTEAETSFQQPTTPNATSEAPSAEVTTTVDTTTEAPNATTEEVNTTEPPSTTTEEPNTTEKALTTTTVAAPDTTTEISTTTTEEATTTSTEEGAATSTEEETTTTTTSSPTTTTTTPEPTVIDVPTPTLNTSVTVSHSESATIQDSASLPATATAVSSFTHSLSTSLLDCAFRRRQQANNFTLELTESVMNTNVTINTKYYVQSTITRRVGITPKPSEALLLPKVDIAANLMEENSTSIFVGASVRDVLLLKQGSTMVAQFAVVTEEAGCTVERLIVVNVVRPELQATPVQVAMTTAISTSVAIASVSGAGGAAALDGQMLVVIGMISCRRPLDQTMAKSSMRAMSPLALSDEFTGILGGSFILLISVIVVHFIVVLVIRSLYEKRRVQNSIAGTRYSTLEYAKSAARFPNLTLHFALLMHQGVCLSTFSLLLEYEFGFGFFLACCSALYIVLLPYGLFTRVVSAAKPHMKYARYVIFDHSNWLVRFVVPQGFWGPKMHALRYGAVLSKVSIRVKFAGLHLFPFVSATLVPLVASFKSSTPQQCNAQQTILMILFLVLAVVVATKRPYRSHFNNFSAAVSFMLLGIIVGISLSPNAAARTALDVVTALEAVLLICRVVVGVTIGILERLRWKGNPTNFVWAEGRCDELDEKNPYQLSSHGKKGSRHGRTTKSDHTESCVERYKAEMRRRLAERIQQQKLRALKKVSGREEEPAFHVGAQEVLLPPPAQEGHSQRSWEEETMDDETITYEMLHIL